MIVRTLIVRKGVKHVIRAIAFPADDGGKRDKCPTLAFFHEQAALKSDEMDKLGALLTETAKNGPPKNDQKFKDLPGTDGLYEFKTTGGLRITCFWDDCGLIICTHGFVKGSQKTPKREISRAKQLKATYFIAKKNGTLTHVQ
jgi:phage-related protein